MTCCGRPGRVSSPSEPIVVGEPNGEPAIRARTTIGLGGLTAGGTGWFTGTHITNLLEQGVLIPLV